MKQWLRIDVKQSSKYSLIFYYVNRIISQTALPIDLFVFLTTPEELSTTITIVNTYFHDFS